MQGDYELDTISLASSRTRLSTYKLDDRPNFEQMLANLDNRSVANSLKDGLRLCLASILHSHQKLIQLLTLLESDDNPWAQLMKDAAKQGGIKKWQKGYLQSLSVIDSASEGLYKTLCSFLCSSTENHQTQTLLEQLKEGKPTGYDGVCIPWGKGSLIHSLVDAMALYLDDDKLKISLRDMFVRKAKRVTDLMLDESGKLEQQYKELNEFFGQNLEYVYGTRLERLAEKLEEDGNAKEHRLPGDCTFVGNLVGNKMQGFGIFAQDGKIIYQGEFVDNVFQGIGTGFANEERVYLGQFKDGRPNGKGVLYKKGMITYKGEVMDGMKHGRGEELYDTGKPCHRGYFYAGKADGFGVNFHKNGKRSFIGTYSKGKRHGFGKEFDINGVDLLEGYWENGRKVTRA